MYFYRGVFSAPKTVQATVTLLENLHIILEKTPRDDIRAEVLPMLYNAFESTTIQVQVRLAISAEFSFVCDIRYFLFAERRLGGRNKCVRISGWNGNSPDDPAENQASLRTKPIRPENRFECTIVRRTNPRPPGQEPNHRRSTTLIVRHTIIRSANHIEGCK